MFSIPQTPVSLPSTTGSSNVKVYARTRPLLEREESQGAKTVVRILKEEKRVAIDDTNEKHFKFEDVFDEDSSQDHVYKTAVAPLVRKVVEGQKATVLAYGQTSSGKTYSMGTCPCTAKEDEGVLQRAMYELLSSDIQGIDTPSGRTPILKLSFMEVYNEEIFDLLSPTRKPLKVKPGFAGAAMPIGMVEASVHSVEEGLTLLEQGTHHRSVASTAINQHSSRSHALIYITLENGGKSGCLILVDLAGAEGVGRAHTSGQQLLEGININKGLLTLGKVLSALSNPSQGFVPYRESILTRLLKDSLGGTSPTSMIACVSPASCNIHETLNTLRYAEQAQNIRMKPQVFSTIKKSGIKRRCEDVTATPGAWKKRALASGKKKDHNTTVSTPGHKPSKKVEARLNSTFATPSLRVNDVLLNSSMLSSHNLAPPCMPPPIRQPIFEDDSPSRFSTISAFENPEPQPPSLSPYLDRVTNQLEQSIMQKFDTIGDMVAEKIVSKLKPKKRKSTRKSLRIAAVDEGRSDESDDSFSAVALSLLGGKAGKKAIKHLISEVMRDTRMENKIESKDAQNQKARIPLIDIGNVKNDPISMQETYLSTNSAMSQPLTSTAFNYQRHVRKSTRSSTARSLHSAIYKDVSPVSKEATSSPALPYSVNEDTIVPNPTDGSPMLQYLKSQNKSDMELEENLPYHMVLDLPSNQPTFILDHKSPAEKPENRLFSSHFQSNKNAKNKAPLRRSTRLSMNSNKKKTSDNLEKTFSSSPLHLEETGKKKTVRRSTRLSMNATKNKISACLENTLSSSPLHVEEMRRKNITNMDTSDTLGITFFSSPSQNDQKARKKMVRRSTRLSAMISTQKNFEILQGCSPGASLCKNQLDTSVCKNLPSKKSHNVTVHAVPAANASESPNKAKWTLVMSPRQQETYCAEILEVLNTGTVRKLQSLPTIGPKTAIILYNYRLMYGTFSRVEDIAKIPALPKSFYMRFMKANLMNRISIDL